MKVLPFSLCMLILTVDVACAVDNVYYFDDNRDPAAPTNSISGALVLHYVGKTHQTADDPKFGSGCMVIELPEEGKSEAQTNWGRAPRAGLASASAAFNGELHKMTITAWIRPPSSTKGFYIFMRRNAPRPESARENTPNNMVQPLGFPPGYLLWSVGRGFAGAGEGFFSFGYSEEYKALFFNFFPAGKGRVTFRSPRFNSVLQGIWIQMGMTFDEGKMVFYVNGLPIATQETGVDGPTSISAATGDAVIAAFYNLEAGGEVDDFGFFTDRAFTSAEMDKVYSDGLKKLLETKAAL